MAQDKYSLEFKCSCGHKQELRVVALGDGQIEFNTRPDKRYKWQAVVIEKKDFKKIIELFKKYGK